MSDDASILASIRTRLDDLTKPKGSLGRLEDHAEKLALIQGRVPPRADRRAVFVLAGDHGVVDEGVSLYPRAVTAQMMHNFMAGGAAINVLSRACGFDVYAVDAGVDADFPAWPRSGAANPDGSRSPGFFSLKACRGSANFARGPALTEAQMDACLAHSEELAAFAADSCCDIVALGDMGIGNTTSAAALLAGLGFELDAVVDRGTGIDDDMLERKRGVIARAVEARGPFDSPMDVARAFAGPELATMAGLILGLRGRRIACVLDGFPVTTAAALAWRVDPSVTDFLFAGHLSRVKGHAPVLAAMGLEPVVDLGMRLGEGTGAVIGGFVVSLGARIAAEMATFSSMGVSRAGSEEKDY